MMGTRGEDVGPMGMSASSCWLCVSLVFDMVCVCPAILMRRRKSYLKLDQAMDPARMQSPST